MVVATVGVARWRWQRCAGWQKTGGKIKVTKKGWQKRDDKKEVPQKKQKRWGSQQWECQDGHGELAEVEVGVPQKGWQKRGGKKEVAEKR